MLLGFYPPVFRRLSVSSFFSKGNRFFGMRKGLLLGKGQEGLEKSDKFVLTEAGGEIATSGSGMDLSLAVTTVKSEHGIQVAEAVVAVYVRTDADAALRIGAETPAAYTSKVPSRLAVNPRSRRVA